MPGSRLLEDALLAIYLYNVPATWQKQFLLLPKIKLRKEGSGILFLVSASQKTETIFYKEAPKRAVSILM
jgi:hypothetical protein